ncbi:FeoA family protein [Calothrix sp. NIES-2098]|uniref:FeoA family protein n=1 Tax=Calothrix sp. NIES-2098 TaxID=1954171 RepID=UPI000B5EC91B|nr:FeoA family protein [Calothrix sp. NIES-2098]
MFTPFAVAGCSLELLRIGETGIVTFCKTPNEKIQKQLLEIGINLETKIAVIEKLPIFKIKVDNITQEIDRETARAIYVRIISCK